jgi:hypothetical protein
MGIAYNPKIVTNGLVLALDAANSKSKGYNVIASPENLGAYLGLRAGASISANSTAAPDGTQTADLLSTSGTGFGYYFPAFPTGNATHSFFLKPAGATNSFRFDHVGMGTGGTFTFSTRTFSSLSNYTGSYEVLPDGWYLVNFHTTNETNLYYIEMSFDNISGAYVWGVQLTPFSYYLPYVPVSANRPQFLNNTMWQDLTGRGSNGTLTNGPTFSGANGGSLVFDGVDDYVSFQCASDTIRAYNSTIQFVVKLPTYAGGQRNILSYRSANSLYIGKASGGIFCYYNTLSPSPAHTVGTIADNAIAHVAVTCDATNNLLSTYINGSLAGSVSRTGWNTTYNTTITLGGSDIEYLVGNFYQFSHYNQVLTSTEIQQNFNATRSRYGI